MKQFKMFLGSLLYNEEKLPAHTLHKWYLRPGGVL